VGREVDGDEVEILLEAALIGRGREGGREERKQAVAIFSYVHKSK